MCEAACLKPQQGAEAVCHPAVTSGFVTSLCVGTSVLCCCQVQVWLVLELCNGGTLKDAVSMGKLRTGNRLELVRHRHDLIQCSDRTSTFMAHGTALGSYGSCADVFIGCFYLSSIAPQVARMICTCIPAPTDPCDCDAGQVAFSPAGRCQRHGILAQPRHTAW